MAVTDGVALADALGVGRGVVVAVGDGDGVTDALGLGLGDGATGEVGATEVPETSPSESLLAPFLATTFTQ